jgi:PAS domain S-box-containing protein/putative nucleotidyltransferase with HDIG domain
MPPLEKSQPPETTIQASEEKFRRLFEASQDGILLLDAGTGIIGDVNPFVIEFLGYSRAELIGKKFWETCPFQNVSASREAFLKLQKKRHFRYDNLQLETKDGQHRYVEFISNVYQAGSQKVVQCNIRDITERKRAEAELQASRAADRYFSERLTILSETTTELSKVESLDTLCRRAVELGRERLDFDRLSIFFLSEDSAAILGTFGVDANGRITDERGDRYPVGADIRPILQSQIPLLRLTDAPLSLKGQTVGRGMHVVAGLWDGNTAIGYITVDNLLRQRPFSDGDCEIIHLYASALGHLCSLKRAQQEIRASEERFTKSFQSNPIATIITTLPDGRLVNVNETFLHLIGYSREEVIGKTGPEVGYWKDTEVRSRLGAALTARESIREVEGLFMTKSGEVRQILVSAETIMIAGQPHGLIMLVDITERKRAEEALRLRMEQMMALNQASQAVTTSLDLDQVLTEVMSLAGKVVGSDYTSVVLVDEAGHISRSVENIPGVLSIEQRARKSGFTKWMLRTRQPAVVDKIGEDGVVSPKVGEGAPLTANPHLVRQGIKSFVGLPLIVEERTVGVLYLHSLRPGTFHAQLPLLTNFANQAAVAIEKARLYAAVQKELVERNQAEEESKESEERYRLLFELSPDAIAVYQDGNIVLANQTTVKLLGAATPEELFGKPIMDFVHPDYRQQVLERSRQQMVEGKVVPTLEEKFLRLDGTVIDVEVTAAPINFQNKLSSMVIFRDITERKQAEEALARERNLLRSLIDNIPDFVYAKDTQGQITLANMGSVRRSNLSVPEELLGTTDYDYFPKELADRYAADDQQVLCSGKSLLDHEELTLDAAGNVRWISTNKVPLRDGHGKIYGLVGMGRDITGRKQSEEKLANQAEELRQRNDELARLYRASGSLISGASLSLQDLAQSIVAVVQQEFGQANCSLLVVSRGSNELYRLAAAGPYTRQVKNKKLSLDGQGLVPQAIRTGATLNVGDVHSRPDYVSNWEAAQSELAIPLKIGNNVIGVIDIQSSEWQAFSPDDERLMSTFAERAALVLEHSRLNTQTEKHMQELQALRTIDMAISKSFDITMTLGILMEQIIRLLGIHAVDILAFNANTQTFKFSCERGFRTHTLQHMQINFCAGYAWSLVRERQMIVVPDIRAEADGLQRTPDLSGEQFVTYVGMPLLAKGQVKGILEIFQREPLMLQPEGYAFLEMLAGQAAIAIDNSELFEHLQSSNAELGMAYDSTLEGWASALELRDKETEGHTRRVAELATRLAQTMGVSDNDILQIYRGALLHDIGKMGVPDSIVLKPGPLTEEEWVIMRKHPQYAADMLSSIAYLRLALDIPYCHHEKWDGTGYPRGLRGGQIPMSARIFAVVDVWDALTSDRPYRKAWQKQEAVQYIQEQSGRHFDPEVVKAFLVPSFKWE